ncbi:hypothetical protein NN3_12570 [Nocardia neocaledoniensis NBRC 108232]|uniref:Uncharacterized protein DUF732 n=1 Tax=Nocardia neocaledoniensis TaxID=236511 RepID=A0A317N7T5_9NOCA|nr:DUF732 domain-containing protein [Nocardia neocaledoniensis]PWV71089.1 uncharacterized protein DUF732 [Nocardia neocaledoniensis]GEM30250.1 hypothetical protein NN3_12570 [Nocardia neocaledoniensis NBRC 108232]
MSQPQYPLGPYPPHPPRRNNTTLWVLLAVFGVLFLVFGSCTAAVLVAADGAEQRPSTEVAPPSGSPGVPSSTKPPRTSAPRPTTSTPNATVDRKLAEQVYIATLDEQGIYYSSRQAALDLATAVCDERAAGVSEVEMVTALAEKGYSIDDAAYLVAAAETQFCPEYA